MSGTKKVVRIMSAAAFFLFLLSSCNWQMFESVQVTGDPEVNVPGGTITGNLNDFLDEIKEGSGTQDQVSEEATKPYTLRVSQSVTESLPADQTEGSTDVIPLPADPGDNDFTPEIGNDVLGFMDSVPEGLNFKNIPFGFELQGDLYWVDSDGNLNSVPEGEVKVSITATLKDNNGDPLEDGDGNSLEDLSVLDDEKDVIQPDATGNDSPEEDRTARGDLADLLNYRPHAIDLKFGFEWTEGTADDNGDLTTGDTVFIDSGADSSIQLDLVFALQATEDINPIKFLEDEETYTQDGDLFQRDSENDLEDELNNFRSAALIFDVRENGTGLDNLEYEVFFDDIDDGHTTIAEGDLFEEDSAEIGIDEDTFEKMRDPRNYPVEPEVELTLPGPEGESDGEYQLNYHTETDSAQLRANVRFRIRTNVDMNFELGDDGQEGS